MCLKVFSAQSNRAAMMRSVDENLGRLLILCIMCRCRPGVGDTSPKFTRSVELGACVYKGNKITGKQDYYCVLKLLVSSWVGFPQQKDAGRVF